jgi:hypothetical protein
MQCDPAVNACDCGLRATYNEPDRDREGEAPPDGD